MRYRTRHVSLLRSHAAHTCTSSSNLNRPSYETDKDPQYTTCADTRALQHVNCCDVVPYERGLQRTLDLYMMKESAPLVKHPRLPADCSGVLTTAVDCVWPALEPDSALCWGHFAPAAANAAASEDCSAELRGHWPFHQPQQLHQRLRRPLPLLPPTCQGVQRLVQLRQDFVQQGHQRQRQELLGPLQLGYPGGAVLALVHRRRPVRWAAPDQLEYPSSGTQQPSLDC